MKGDDAFPIVAPSVFQVCASWDDHFVAGTRFVVAVYGELRRLVVATAKHVIDVPDDRDISWTSSVRLFRFVVLTS